MHVSAGTAVGGGLLCLGLGALGATLYLRLAGTLPRHRSEASAPTLPPSLPPSACKHKPLPACFEDSEASSYSSKIDAHASPPPPAPNAPTRLDSLSSSSVLEASSAAGLLTSAHSVVCGLAAAPQAGLGAFSPSTELAFQGIQRTARSTLQGEGLPSPLPEASPALRTSPARPALLRSGAGGLSHVLEAEVQEVLARLASRAGGILPAQELSFEVRGSGEEGWDSAFSRLSDNPAGARGGLPLSLEQGALPASLGRADSSAPLSRPQSAGHGAREALWAAARQAPPPSPGEEVWEDARPREGAGQSRASSPLAPSSPSRHAAEAAPGAAGQLRLGEVDVLSRIGGGAQGAVYRASWRGAPVAVKVAPCRRDDPGSLGGAVWEVALSRQLSHPNVVQCFAWTVLTAEDQAGWGGEEAGEGEAIPSPPVSKTRPTFLAPLKASRDASCGQEAHSPHIAAVRAVQAWDLSQAAGAGGSESAEAWGRDGGSAPGSCAGASPMGSDALEAWTAPAGEFRPRASFPGDLAACSSEGPPPRARSPSPAGSEAEVESVARADGRPSWTPRRALRASSGVPSPLGRPGGRGEAERARGEVVREHESREVESDREPGSHGPDLARGEEEASSPPSASAARRRLSRLRVPPALEREFSAESRMESFNSDDGFGSPVKHRLHPASGSTRSLFELERRRLGANEALVVAVLEHCDLGSLSAALARGAFRPSARWSRQLTYRALLRTAQEVAKGVHYLHGAGIVHGDLKPANVLLRSHKADRRGYVAKVADFGLACPSAGGEQGAREPQEDALSARGCPAWSPRRAGAGTLAYAAPEVLAGGAPSPAADAYGFGVLLWEMFHGARPHQGLLDVQILAGILCEDLRPAFAADCPPELRGLCVACWDARPERRPSLEQAAEALVRIEMDFRRRCQRDRANQRRGAEEASP